MEGNNKNIISDDHRHRCFWEVIYDEKIDLSEFKLLKINDINAKKCNGDHFKNYVIDISFEKINSTTTENIKKLSKRLIIENTHFDSCDIIGNNGGCKITFKNCKFSKVYFGYSILNDINFENCSFFECSFSLTRFYRCIFDEKCKFKKISISGGKTNFVNCAIDAENLLYNTFRYATREYCSIQGLDYKEQQYRMFSSLVKLSRNILSSVSSVGDDDIYYKAIKSLFKLKIEERQRKREYNSTPSKEKRKIFDLILPLLNFLLSFTFPIEKAILNSFGFINGWGGSFIRCIFFGFLIFFSFSLYYIIESCFFSKINESVFFIISKGMIKSIDITFLAGYTKYTTAGDEPLKQFVNLLNMMFGLVWYAVSFPTLINKISIARI